MHYDHIAFHFDQHYPDDLPQQNAVHHIGFYFAWAVSQNLHHPDWEAADGFAALREGKTSGTRFVLDHMAGELRDDDFNELGRRFTTYYYHDEEDGYGLFLEDYFRTLGLESEQDFYRTDDNADNQQALNRTFQTAFERWRDSLKSPAL